MEVKIAKENENIVVAISGHLDTITSGELERQVTPLLADGASIVFECRNLSYVSSSGLRVILAVHKKLSGNGGAFVLRHIAPEIRSILDMTGLSAILHIE